MHKKQKIETCAQLSAGTCKSESVGHNNNMKIKMVILSIEKGTNFIFFTVENWVVTKVYYQDLWQ